HETGYSETETAGLFFTSEEPAAARFEEFQSILSPEEYDLFLKKYRDGLPYQALAKITHTSVSGSRARLSRIKKKLRKHLPEFSTEAGSGSQHKPLG
ncbi:sigma factor-like helix-turn-helix DNA-binding protein, partial [Faecalibaculum rodentium]|uniref:sigma factor-like helix-turn-helix DNA-binding protein n=1 Tax=Faecalibaculum rodentium TaxID=1702221 RepID=UPI0025A079F4